MVGLSLPFTVPPDHAAVSGGNLYNSRLIAALQRTSCTVRAVDVETGLEEAGQDGSLDIVLVSSDAETLPKVLHERVLPAENPVFVFYVSVTRHAPFSETPPDVEEWGAASAAAASSPPVKDYGILVNNSPWHPDVEAGYIDTIQYSLRTMFGYALALPRPSLVIVLGDQQPLALGRLPDADPSRDVPIHVLSNRFLTRFLRTLAR